MSENEQPAKPNEGWALARLRHDVWMRYAMNFIAGAFTAGMFYTRLTGSAEQIQQKLEAVTNQQGKMLEQLQRLTTAEETLAEHVHASDRRQDDDHHRIEKLEDGKR